MYLQIQIMWRYRRSNTASLSPSHISKKLFDIQFTMNQANQQLMSLDFMISMPCVSQGNQKANPQKELYSFLVLCSNTFVELFWSKENHPVWLILKIKLENKLHLSSRTFRFSLLLKSCQSVLLVTYIIYFLLQSLGEFLQEL